MAEVHFTAWLRDLVPQGVLRAEGETVGDALAAVFAELPHVRGYVLDDHGRLRKHVCVFADGERLPCDATMDHPIGAGTKLYVMQALSGG